MNLAPLKTYLIPLAVLNIARQLLVPPSEVGDAVSVALFAATAATVFLVVTVDTSSRWHAPRTSRILGRETRLTAGIEEAGPTAARSRSTTISTRTTTIDRSSWRAGGGAPPSSRIATHRRCTPSRR